MLQKQISYVVFGIGESNQDSENMKTRKAPEKKQKNTYSRGLGDRGSSQESPNIVFCFSKVLFFFGFLDGVLHKESPNIVVFSFFWFSGWGPTQRVSKYSIFFDFFSGSWWCGAE
jgi:hypothetical protein